MITRNLGTANQISESISKTLKGDKPCSITLIGKGKQVTFKDDDEIAYIVCILSIHSIVLKPPIVRKTASARLSSE